MFATGATPPLEEEIERFRKDNLPDDIDIPFFYFQSGINYEKMSGGDKLLMKILKTVLSMKKNKSDLDQGVADAIRNSYDYSSQSQIEPLIQFANTLGHSK